MSIPVTCTSCGHKFKAKEKYAGRSGGCPECGATVKVPAAAQSTVKQSVGGSSPGGSSVGSGVGRAKSSKAAKGSLATLACGDCGDTFKAQLQSKARDAKCPSCGVELTIPADPNRQRAPAASTTLVPVPANTAIDNLWDELPNDLGSGGDASSGFSLAELPAAGPTALQAPQLPKKKIQKRQSSISFDDPMAAMKAGGLALAALIAVGVLGWGAINGSFLGACELLAQLVLLGCYITVVVRMCQHGRYGLAIFSGGGWLLGMLIIFGTLGAAIAKSNETNQAPEAGEMGAMLVAVGFAGLLTVVSGLTTYIVGWVKSNEWRLSGVMLTWTFCFLFGLVAGFLSSDEEVMAEGEPPAVVPPGLFVAEPEAPSVQEESNTSPSPAKQSPKSGLHVKLENAVYVVGEDRMMRTPEYGVSVDYTFDADGHEGFHRYYWVIENSQGRSEMDIFDRGQGTLQGSLSQFGSFGREQKPPTNWRCWIEIETSINNGRSRVSEVITMRSASQMPPPKEYVPLPHNEDPQLANNSAADPANNSAPGAPPASSPFRGPPPEMPREMELEEALAILDESDRNRLRHTLRWFKDHPPVKEQQAEVARKLAELVEHPDTFVQKYAIEALSVWGTDEQIPLWITLLKNESFVVRNEARDVLATTDSPQAAKAIAGLLEDDRIGAKKALTQMGPVAESAVIVMLEHPDQFMRGDASEILGEIGGKDSMRALKKLADDPSGIPRMKAEEAYYKIEFRLKQQERNKPSPALERVD